AHAEAAGEQHAPELEAALPVEAGEGPELVRLVLGGGRLLERVVETQALPGEARDAEAQRARLDAQAARHAGHRPGDIGHGRGVGARDLLVHALDAELDPGRLADRPVERHGAFHARQAGARPVVAVRREDDGVVDADVELQASQARRRVHHAGAVAGEDRARARMTAGGPQSVGARQADAEPVTVRAVDVVRHAADPAQHAAHV